MVRERWKEEEITIVATRRCVNPFSSDVFEELGPMEDLGRVGDSWRDLYGESDVLGEAFPSKIVKPQFSAFT